MKNKLNKIINIEDYMEKPKKEKYTLRKITTIGLTTIGLINAISTLAEITEKKELTPIPEVTILDENEIEIVDTLELYSSALQEYENIISQKNHSELEEIEKRIMLIKQTRNLISTANYLMEEKVKEAFNIKDEEANVYVQRITDTQNPYDLIYIESESKDLNYTITDLPKEFIKILNQEESIKIYEGTGENSAWNKEINFFIKKGNDLYNSIVNLLEKDYYLENDNIKIKTTAKSI